MARITLPIFTLICFFGTAYGVNNCSLRENRYLYTELKDILTYTDCPPIHDCCMKDGRSECCSLPEYLGLDGSIFILLLGLIFVMVFYCCRGYTDSARVHVPAAGFVRMV